MMEECIDIGIVTNIPSPYRIPLFNSIAGFEDVNLTVYFMDVTEKNRSWKVSPEEWQFNYEILEGSSLYSSVLDRSIAVNWGVIDRFREACHDVIVISGYNHTTGWLALVYSKFSGTPVVPWSGTWDESIRLDNPIVNTIRQAYTHSGQAWLAYGSRAATALSSWGADKNRIFEMTNTVDVEWFSEQSKKVSRQGNVDNFELLYCGQLIKRKNVRTVIQALSRVSIDEVVFRVIGDGPEETMIRNQADQSDVEVVFEGFVQRDELYRYYTNSDALVLPSTEEVWGLVVNEALACGTPALVSKMCGCAPDLIRDNFNGNTFDPDSPKHLASLLEDIITGQKKYAKRPEIRQDALDRFNIENSAISFVAACRTAIKFST